MASKALDEVEGPVQECVSQVYTLLVAAARDAAAVSGEHTEAAMNGKVPLNVPEFKTFIMPAIVRALDEWRTEGEKSECQKQPSSRTGRHGVWSWLVPDLTGLPAEIALAPKKREETPPAGISNVCHAVVVTAGQCIVGQRNVVASTCR